ncbi:MAG: YggS family pyridoxal phosphate-dependent enzyme [Rikenellaceae bacterium]
MSVKSQIESIRESLPSGVELVAVSKTHPAEAVSAAYAVGQRKFGESRPQELKAKWEVLPRDIEWHMIGHLQTNKVKMVVPYVTLIESLDSLRLAEAIEREAAKCDKIVDCLLEVHVAQEESKTGWNYEELKSAVESGVFDQMPHIRLRGVMGIASNTYDESVVRRDFEQLRLCKEELSVFFGPEFDTLSMGMSDDYELAVECGSTSVRVGSKIFGARDYSI